MGKPTSVGGAKLSQPSNLSRHSSPKRDRRETGTPNSAVHNRSDSKTLRGKGGGRSQQHLVGTNEHSTSNGKELIDSLRGSVAAWEHNEDPKPDSSRTYDIGDAVSVFVDGEWKKGVVESLEKE